MRSIRKLEEVFGPLKSSFFRGFRALAVVCPGGRISAFGKGSKKIEKVLIINLARQPNRLRRTFRELSRFRTCDGHPLTTISHRFPAIDARDGREVASTADVDATYRMRDQLYVQPDARLRECFDVDEPIKMSRQEVAVARSHIEVWKAIATGHHEHVLILEDDVWFTLGAANAIDKGWTASQNAASDGKKSHLLYISYEDAGGSAERGDFSDNVFRPGRGLWLLSGYVLSRTGARILLESMPVIGPVDMWINRQFKNLGALALSSPVILQRRDGGSDNSHSIMPYLARAGIVDAQAAVTPKRSTAGPILAWSSGTEYEGLAMALSMLGFRVRVFDVDDEAINEVDLKTILECFDVLVDANFSQNALFAAIANSDIKFVVETRVNHPSERAPSELPASRTILITETTNKEGSWQPLCGALDLMPPPHPFPMGPPRAWRIFRDDRPASSKGVDGFHPSEQITDDSAWALVPKNKWPLLTGFTQEIPFAGQKIIHESMTSASSNFLAVQETFPGNLATFNRNELKHELEGTKLTIREDALGNKPYRSAAFASSRSFGHGRFQAEIKAARGSGLVTGFFLHRASPRQEVDVELIGDNPRSMLVNVYFNPGDDGTAIGFGYRGSPCKIDLDFDVTADFHLYSIDWRPDSISWSIDGKLVHHRVGWDPTPIPHLPMRLHANLWAPRSTELAGKIDECSLPANATFRNVSIWN